MEKLTPQLLDRATHPDAKPELQLVVVTGPADDERIIAGTRYSPTETDGDCEFAIAVLDDRNGRPDPPEVRCGP